MWRVELLWNSVGGHSRSPEGDLSKDLKEAGV